MPETREKTITFTIKKIGEKLRAYSPHGIIDIKKPGESYRYLSEEHAQAPPKSIKAKVLEKPYVNYLIEKMKVNYRTLDNLKPEQKALVKVAVHVK